MCLFRALVMYETTLWVQRRSQLGLYEPFKLSKSNCFASSVQFYCQIIFRHCHFVRIKLCTSGSASRRQVAHRSPLTSVTMMCPIVKNNFDIYQTSAVGSPVNPGMASGPGSQSRSRKTSQCSNRSRSHAISPGAGGGCGTSGPTSLSSSPGSDLDERLRSVVSGATDGFHPMANRSRRISRCSEHGTSATSANVVPQSVSSSSLNKFHMRLVDKLRRALRSKDDSALKTTTTTTTWSGSQTPVGRRNSIRRGANRFTGQQQDRRCHSYPNHYRRCRWQYQDPGDGDLIRM